MSVDQAQTSRLCEVQVQVGVLFVFVYRAKKLGPGQYLDRSETGAAVPADLTQHPALPVSLKPLFPLITIYRHDVEY